MLSSNSHVAEENKSHFSLYAGVSGVLLKALISSGLEFHLYKYFVKAEQLWVQTVSLADTLKSESGVKQVFHSAA